MIRYILVFICLLWVAQTPSYAADESIYVVRDINVIRDGNDANLARQDAISQAQKFAFYEVISRVVDSRFDLPDIDDAVITKIVHGFEIKDEVIADNKYESYITVTINKEGLDKFVEQHNLLASNEEMDKVLVLPILNHGDKSILWKSSNYWMMAWKSLVNQNNNLPIIVPNGDLEDKKIIDIKDILAGNKKNIVQIAEKYGASSVIIANAEFGDYFMDVTLSTMDIFHFPDRRFTYNRLLNESIPSFLYSAASDAANQIVNFVRKGEVPDVKYSRITVISKINGLKEWNILRDKLSKIEMIKPFSIQQLRYDEVRIELYYNGGFKEFTRFLLKYGVQLKDIGDEWHLTLVKELND